MNRLINAWIKGGISEKLKTSETRVVTFEMMTLPYQIYAAILILTLFIFVIEFIQIAKPKVHAGGIVRSYKSKYRL